MDTSNAASAARGFMSENPNPVVTSSHAPDSAPRRDFLLLTAQAMGAVGAAALVWPLIDSMNPSADVLALGTTEVDLGAIGEGQEIKVMWRGKPVFIRHRTQK